MFIHIFIISHFCRGGGVKKCNINNNATQQCTHCGAGALQAKVLRGCALASH